MKHHFYILGVFLFLGVLPAHGEDGGEPGIVGEAFAVPADEVTAITVATPDTSPTPKREAPLSEGAERFGLGVQIGTAVDNAMVEDLKKIHGLHGSIEAHENLIQKLQNKLEELQNTPLPPVPQRMPPTSQGSPNNGGGSSGDGPQAPEMPSLAESSSFQSPEAPKDITPDVSGADFGDREPREYNPGSTALKGYTPTPLENLNSKTGSQGQFGPEQIASGELPKLTTLEPTQSKAGGAPAAAPNSNAGSPGNMMGGGMPGGSGMGAGGDGAVFANSPEANGDGPSGITTRDAGWGASSGSDASDSSANSGNGYDSSNGTAQKPGQIADQNPASKGRSFHPSIFGKVAFWIQERCGLLPGSKSEDKPAFCEKAAENDQQLALSDDAFESEKNEQEKSAEPIPPKRKFPRRAVTSGLREIASENAGQTGSVPVEGAEDLLGALRAGAF